MFYKKKVGKIISEKMQKTLVVGVARLTRHKKYNKTIIQTKRYIVHDNSFNRKLGDLVTFCKTIPVSKTKCWKIISAT